MLNILLPLLAYFLGRNKVKNDQLIVWIIGVSYLAFIGYIFIKTKAGIPFWL